MYHIILIRHKFVITPKGSFISPYIDDGDKRGDKYDAVFEASRQIEILQRCRQLRNA